MQPVALDKVRRKGLHADRLECQHIERIKKREDVQLVELVESRRETPVEGIVGKIKDLYVQGKR